MAQTTSFTMGVDAVFKLNGDRDCMVAGDVSGTVRVGDIVTVWDPGNDSGKVFQAHVASIETGPHRTASEATDCTAALLLEGAAGQAIRPCSVVADGGADEEQVRNAYTLAILKNYVLPKRKGDTESPELTDALLERMTISDLSEAWWLYGWYHTEHSSSKQEALAHLDSDWSQRCRGALEKKILEADRIYCVFNRSTEYPHLFTEISRIDDNQYECSRPSIRLYPVSHKAYVEPKLDSNVLELRCIQRGTAGTGIVNFLNTTFWQDGACAVEVANSRTVIAAEQLVAPPDFADADGSGNRVVPVANPQLVRWMLLMGQMGRPQTDDERTAYQLYWNFFCQELPAARLLQPVQMDRSAQRADDSVSAGTGAGDSAYACVGAQLSEESEGKPPLPVGVMNGFEEGLKMTFALMEGKEGRQAAYLYTDWKRFRSKWGAGWEGLVQSAGDVLQLFDCAINVTDSPVEGCYVSDAVFRQYCAVSE